MQLVVTGGAGFIGSTLVDQLLAGGHSVIAIDDFNSYYNPAFKKLNVVKALQNPRYRLVEADIADRTQMNDLFGQIKADMIIHLAARAGVRASVQDPFLYQRVNVEGTLNLLECARTHGIKKITFGSTSSVYGVNTKVPFSESDLVQNTVSPYAATKLAGEALARSYSHLYGIDVAVLRFFSVYGPRGRPDMAIYQFTEKMMRGKPIGVFGDGSSERDYTYVDDIVQGIMATIDKQFGFEIFNLGESETIALKDLILLLEKTLGLKAIIDVMPEQPGDVPRTFADIAKARRLLDYKPVTPIHVGIPKFYKWFQAERWQLLNTSK